MKKRFNLDVMDNSEILAVYTIKDAECEESPERVCYFMFRKVTGVREMFLCKDGDDVWLEEA